MSGKVVGWAMELRTGSPITKLVLVKLADNANEEGTCWPSISKIMAHSELGRLTSIQRTAKLIGALLSGRELTRADVTGLLGGNCYRWTQTLTNSIGKQGFTTSGWVLVDTTSATGSINFPEANRVTSGVVHVTGTATDAGSFRDWTLEYGVGASPVSWTFVASGTAQVQAPTELAAWDSRPLAGFNTLRLTVRDWAGNTAGVVTQTFYVENSLRGEEDYRTQVPFDLGGGWNLAIGSRDGSVRTFDCHLCGGVKQLAAIGAARLAEIVDAKP